jgi:hypothetical protein
MKATRSGCGASVASALSTNAGCINGVLTTSLSLLAERDYSPILWAIEVNLRIQRGRKRRDRSTVERAAPPP